MSQEKYTAADVLYIPFSAYTNAYDDRPNATQDPYGQLAIPNIVNTALPKYAGCQIGSYIYRSFDWGTLIPYIQHIKSFLEPNAGAHYYVMSGYSDTYSKASAVVPMSSVSCNRAGHRNGYISLSLVTGNIVDGDDTSMNQCDIGLVYTQLPDESSPAWYPASWSKNVKAGGNLPYDLSFTSHFIVGDSLSHINEDDKYKPYKIPQNATVRLEIEVKIITENNQKKDVVEGHIYVDNIEQAKIRYKAARGTYFSAYSQKPYVRFTRFMSLVPEETDDAKEISGDYPDDSRLHGIMQQCRLGSTPWSNDLIAFAWSVAGVNIESLKISTLATDPIASDADECIIYNHHPTHMKNM